MKGLSMEDKLVVSKLNETFMRLDCDHSMLYELSDEFQFLIPGAKFNPKVKAKVWDGKIRLVNIYAQKTYIGLYNQIKDFCARRNYKFVGYELFNPDITPQFTAQFIKTLNLPPEISFRDYQYYAVHKALKNKRALILSPTGSGKSAQIYSIVRYLVENDKKVLVVVPTIGLTTQMKNDFIDYSKNKDKFEDQIHIIYSGKEKQTDKPVTISTWQSIYKMGKEWYQQWDAILVDEVHQAKATSLTTIVESCTNAEYKVGFTGSLDNALTHKMMITSLFTDPTKVATTRELINKGYLSEIEIKCKLLLYPEDVRKVFKKIEYKKEIDYIVQNEARLKYVVDLVNGLKGNTLVLFNFVEKHGEKLYNELKDKTNKTVYFIHGGVSADDREEFRQLTEQNDNVVIIASVGTTSTGVNIKRLHNLVLAQPTKSVIRVLQSIGRGLRVHNQKDGLVVFDIADDLRHGKKDNHTFNHFVERLDIYTKEEFEYSIEEVSLE